MESVGNRQRLRQGNPGFLEEREETGQDCLLRIWRWLKYRDPQRVLISGHMTASMTKLIVAMYGAPCPHVRLCRSPLHPNPNARYSEDYQSFSMREAETCRRR